MAELRAGWHFLRADTTLLANTIQAAIAQIAVGILLAITSIWAYQVFSGAKVGWEGAWGLVEAGSAAGNIIGGLAIGLVGSRVLKGRLIIAGYAVWGFLTILLALSGDLTLAVGISFGAGIANMAFIIPSQALFQQRTPSHLMGRVVSFRFALVFGSMTLAMGVGSILTAFVPGRDGDRLRWPRRDDRRAVRPVRAGAARRVTDAAAGALGTLAPACPAADTAARRREE